MKKINALFLPLACVTALACLSSCEGEKQPELEFDQHIFYEGNIHDLSSTDLDTYMVENGACDYRIFISENASDTIKIARDEFIYFFNKATNISLSWTTDNGLEHSADQKIISIGDTSLFRTSGLEIDKLELGNDGLIIETVDNNIYLIGGSDYGSLYSVYDFMKICFNYEQYTHKTYDIDTNVRNLKLKDFSVKNIPDIPMRCHSYGFMGVSANDYDQKMFGYRMREDRIRNDHRMNIHMYNYADDADFLADFGDKPESERCFEDLTPEHQAAAVQKYSKSGAKKSTNSDTVVNYVNNFEKHPKWFSDNSKGGSAGTDNGNQLCYTCHGDQDEYNALVKYVAEKFEMSMRLYTPEKYPTLNCLLLMMEDNFNTCNCASCLEASQRYGAESGAVIVFMNKVAEKVVEWQDRPENAQYKREDLRLNFNAYNAFESAPTHYDEEQGKYVPNHEDVVMNEHLGVYFAEINNLDNQKTFFDEINVSGKAMFDGWAAISPWLEFWVYETNFSSALYFYDSFAFTTQKFFNYIAASNVKMIFSQGIDTDGHCGWTGICWNQLKAYLNSKLTWDSTLDEGKLVEQWFKGVYKEAAPSMRKLFNTMRSYYGFLLSENESMNALRSIYFNYSKHPELYPLATLQSFISIVDEALTHIEKYKVSPETYSAIANEIEAQAIFPLYVIMENFYNDLTPEDKVYYSTRILNAISNLNIESCVTKESGESILASVQAKLK